MNEINLQEFTQKLSEKYQYQCLTFFQEILSLQTQIDLKDKKIEELEARLVNEKVDVNTTPIT